MVGAAGENNPGSHGGVSHGRHRAFQTPRVVAAPMQRCGSISGALAQAARHNRLLATHCCSALRCAALRLGRVRRPPERGGRRLCCACGRWSRPPREGKILGARGSGVCPGGPNWPRSSCAAHLCSTGAASNSKLKPPCAVYFLCVAQVVVVNGWHRRRENPGARGQVQVPCFLNSWWKWNCWKVGAAGEKN